MRNQMYYLHRLQKFDNRMDARYKNGLPTRESGRKLTAKQLEYLKERRKITRRIKPHLLRHYQKEPTALSWTDYLAFVRDHWRLPLEAMARSGRPQETRLRQRLTSRVGAVLGLDLAALEESATKAARDELETALAERLQAMERLFAE